MHILLALAVIAILIAVIYISRATELFCISVREGELLVLRGRVPPTLRQDFEDVVKRAQVEDAQIRAHRSSGHARLTVTGADEFVAQRLRNTFGAHKLSRLQNAPAVENRNLGQLLGIAWLAWLLHRR